MLGVVSVCYGGREVRLRTRRCSQGGELIASARGVAILSSKAEAIAKGSHHHGVSVEDIGLTFTA